MNKRDQLNEHGNKLNETFNTTHDPDKFARKLHQLEAKMHRVAEHYCNGEVDDAELNAVESDVLDRLDHLTGWRKQNIPVFINQDPRGYALKIDNETGFACDLPRDWGGYYLLAPDLTTTPENLQLIADSAQEAALSERVAYLEAQVTHLENIIAQLKGWDNV